MFLATTESSCATKHGLHGAKTFLHSQMVTRTEAVYYCLPPHWHIGCDDHHSKPSRKCERLVTVKGDSDANTNKKHLWEPHFGRT